MKINYGGAPGSARIIGNQHGDFYFTHDELPGSGPLAFPISMTGSVEILDATPEDAQWVAARLERSAEFLSAGPSRAWHIAEAARLRVRFVYPVREAALRAVAATLRSDEGGAS